MVETSNSASTAVRFRSRWWIRIALFVFHIAIVATAMSLTPAGYFFQLGEDIGIVLVLGSIVFFCLLLSAKTRRGLLLLGLLPLGLAGITALVGLHFRSEDKVLQAINEEWALKRHQWVDQMQHFRMDSLFEMTSGKRRLSVAELREVQARARSGREKVDEMQSDLVRSIAQMEGRIAAVSAAGADAFRRGVESTQATTEEQVKLMQDYFSEIEGLTGFLIKEEGRYFQTSKGLVFKTEAEARAFNNQLDAIAGSKSRMLRFAADSDVSVAESVNSGRYAPALPDEPGTSERSIPAIKSTP